MQAMAREPGMEKSARRGGRARGGQAKAARGLRYGPAALPSNRGACPGVFKCVSAGGCPWRCKDHRSRFTPLTLIETTRPHLHHQPGDRGETEIDSLTAAAVLRAADPSQGMSAA
jgi:hypothetical protein